MQRKVVIVTRTKNRPLLLQRAIESVLAQTHPDWLHAIVNDGGDPATVEAVAARFTDRYQGRLKVIHNAVSVGMQNASNLGIQATQSEYVTIHDDDDSWHPQFLEECVKYLEAVGPDSTEQGVAAQTSWILEEIDSWGNIVEFSRHDYLPFESVSLYQTAGRNVFPPIAFLYRRKVHDTIGYFNQVFNELGDYDFNLRFLSHFDIGVISRKLAGYHWRHQAHGSSYGNTVTDGIGSHRKMLVKMQNHYLRQDLAAQRMGLGFLLNSASALTAGFESQQPWMKGVSEKTDHVADSMRRLMKKLVHYEKIADTILTPWRSRALPRRVYDHVMDVVFPPARFKRAPSRDKAQAWQAALEAGVEKAVIVSLDVFDTTLLRLVRKPTDLFLYLQPAVRELLNRPDLGFVTVRVAAEEEARQEQRRARNSGEVTLNHIYGVLRRRLDCDEATAERVKQLELEAERRLCYANPAIARVAALVPNGKRQLVFCSDMYLPAREITALLEQNGFKGAPLFVSSELLLTKHEGTMYDHLFTTLKCSPEAVVHIGDNAQSDVDRARAKGIKAFHWKASPEETPLVDQQNSFSGAWEGDLAASLYTGLARRRRLSHPPGNAPGKEFWEMIGYEVVGPLYHAFISWTIGRATKLGIKKLFFLARDGFQLVKVFEQFREKQGLKMEAAYLFASRRLWNVPRMDKLDEENLYFLATPNPCMRVRDFLERTGINAQPHEALVRRLGFQGLDERVTTSRGVFNSETYHQNIRRLIRGFENEMLAQAAREREKLLAYFEDIGLLQGGGAIVDVGWQASSIKSLHKILTLAGKPQQIPGFYFGTWHYAEPVADAGCQFESFFVHLHKPHHRAALAAEAVELLESFFSAPHATITGIDRKNGKWEPTYGEPEVDAEMEAALQIVTHAAFEFVRDALELWPDTNDLAPAFGYLETVLDRFLRHPRREEATAFGKFALRNTFGGAGPVRQVANPPSAWTRISGANALQDAYDHCYWKAGFLAQLSARAKKHLKL